MGWFFPRQNPFFIFAFLYFFSSRFFNVCHFYVFCFIGTHPNDVLKMPSLSRNGNGYWLDASTGGMVWRTQPSGDTLDMQKDQIDDYAPVCLTNNTANGSNNTNERGNGSGGGQQQR